MITLTHYRAALAGHVPPWLNTPIDRQFFQTLRDRLTPQTVPLPRTSIEILPPLDPLALNALVPNSFPTDTLPEPKRPHWRRSSQVYAVLDQVRSQHESLPSYSQLITVVQRETGLACSRKLISRWKLDRGLRS